MINPPLSKLIHKLIDWRQRVPPGFSGDNRGAEVSIQVGVNRARNMGFGVILLPFFSIFEPKTAIHDNPIWIF